MHGVSGCWKLKARFHSISYISLPPIYIHRHTILGLKANYDARQTIARSWKLTCGPSKLRGEVCWRPPHRPVLPWSIGQCRRTHRL